MGKAVDDRQDRDDTTEQAKHAGHRLAVNTISDPGSFRDATCDGHEIAGLYLTRELDILIDPAHAVATDFFARPQRYKEVDTQEPAKRIARLHARYGNDERFLSYEQRTALFAPLFAERRGLHPLPRRAARRRGHLLGVGSGHRHTALHDAASSDTATSASVAPAPPTSSALLNGVSRETPAL